MKKRRLAMFISGGGTTMEQVLLAIDSGRLQNVEPVLIVASKFDAGGIAKAKTAGMWSDEVVVIRRGEFSSREVFGWAIVRECQDRGVDLIFQCGWLPMTPKNVVTAYAGRIYNQHPGALDPGFLGFGGCGMFGMRVHYVALEFARVTGRWFTEATVHRVTADEEFDVGDVVGRIPVEIRPDDTPESLQRRVLPMEHELVINTMQAAVAGKLSRWSREERLIRTPEEIKLRARLVSEAAKLYPHG